MAATDTNIPSVYKEQTISISNPRRWTVVWLLFVASLINYFDRATISFALPLISKELNLGPEVKGVLLSAFFWSYALMQIPIGYCADRMNLRWLYAGAFALWSVSQGMMGLAGSLTTLIIFRVILGIGESIYLPGGTKIVSLMFPTHQRGLPCGLFDFGTRTGLVIEGVLLPWMLAKLGWRTTFMIIGFTALLWLIPWLVVLPKKLSVPKTARENARPVTPLEAIRTLVTNRNLIGICVGFFCFDYYWYLLLTWLPNYLIEKRDLGMLQGGFYASLPFLVFGICQPLGGWIADRLIALGYDEMRVRKTIVSVAFLTGLFLIPVTEVKSANAALGLLLFGAVVGLSTANMLVILQACAPRDKVGLWVGIYNFVGNIAGILAPLVTGILIKKTGAYAMPFMLASLLLLFGIYSFWAIVGRVKRADS